MKDLTTPSSGLLTWAEIATLFTELDIVRDFISARADLEPLAGHIQKPKLPPVASESIVGQLLLSGTLTLPGIAGITDVRRGGSAGDLVVRWGGPDVVVEVKGMQDQGFTAFNMKDLEAPFVVWLELEASFRHTREARLHLIPDPGGLGFVPGQRMDVRRLAKLAIPSVIELQVTLPL